MKTKSYLLSLLAVYVLFTSITPDASAESNDSSINTVLYLTPQDSISSYAGQPEEKTVKVQELNFREMQNLSRNLDDFIDEHGTEPENMYYAMMYDPFIAATNNYLSESIKSVPSGVQLVRGKETAIQRMPVLDQADTDTCATFSSIAALGILAGNGEDKYSIYKTLCLGHALSLNMVPTPQEMKNFLVVAKADSLPNPWDGSEGFIIFAQLKSLGLIEKRDANSRNGKFGQNEIKQPLNPGELKNFKKIPSLQYNILFSSYKHENIKQAFKTESDFIKAVKKEIMDGNIVSIGLNLAVDYKNSNMGMLGVTRIVDGKPLFSKTAQKDVANYNTWCTDTNLGNYIKKNLSNEDKVGAHQMIIIGYIDIPSKKDDGLFILRNSWGASSGDKGNNYVTYKYAYLMCDEITSVSVR